MHEMSLAQEVCEIAVNHVPRDQIHQIVVVGLEVGEASGVEPNNLAFWLETFLESPPFGAARPQITEVYGDVFRVTFLEVDDGSSDD